MFENMSDEEIEQQAESMLGLDDKGRAVMMLQVAIRIARASERAASALETMDREAMAAFLKVTDHAIEGSEKDTDI